VLAAPATPCGEGRLGAPHRVFVGREPELAELEGGLAGDATKALAYARAAST
jgi:hypothetical protein